MFCEVLFDQLDSYVEHTLNKKNNICNKDLFRFVSFDFVNQLDTLLLLSLKLYELYAYEHIFCLKKFSIFVN